MKVKRSISIMLSMLIVGNISYIFAEGTAEKVLTTEEINKIIKNENNVYGTPNKYWNEETGEFTIPDGYTKVEKGAFPSDNYLPFIKAKVKKEKCLIKDKVKKIVIPKTLVDIEEGAFCGSPVQEINMLDSVKKIGKGAFGETNIKEIKWPKSVTKIEDGMFGYANLERIEIPNTVTSIGDGAFLGTRLTEINIPDSVTEIKNGAFSDSNQLKKVKLPNNIKKLDNGLFWRNDFEEIEIPASVMEIGDRTFTGCKIKEIKLPEGLTKIGNDVFWYCEDLERIEMPGVTTMGNYVFSNCNKLKRLVVSQKFFKSKEISRKAFEGEGEEFYDQPGEGIKEGTVEVYVTDGLKGLNIEEIKATNRWIKNIKEEPKGKSEGSKKAETKTIPNTGIGENIILLALMLTAVCIITLRRVRK